ncbi:MAG: STAS domain-containing protein [Proteobacteria bacterium]|nr:STAS domain-containing protein [Pseudomonadota bacterium]MBU1138902.1 STAS domain-containing protein [Pseudomonadota bacterium]MBU1231714.1 STAS domain-containing protein [Pseudomonadota bacterium]MBU1418742.1 STAS domain-containing protein [Pseudomonadota bacterium]MBU1456545.1 STAS domain-containing protein [Pseudomonadota bacterium]
MKIKTEIINSIFIVTFEGPRLDASFAQDFLNAMKGFIQKGHLDILLDLTAVDFVDSTGLGSIVRCLKEIDSRGQLVLCGVNEMVLSLLQMTRLDKIFTRAADRDEALNSLSWQRPKRTGTTISAVSGIPKEDEDDYAILLEVEDADVKEIASDERRRHRRIGHRQILDEDLVAYCTNTATGKNSTAVILNISPGGILMISTSHHSIGDELLIRSSIGKNFKLKELTVIRSCHDGEYGLEFMNPSEKTSLFLNQLTGAVILEHNDRFRHF